MTPDDHALKAEEYLRSAAQLRRDYLDMTGATVHRAGPDGTELLAEAQLLATLAAAHSTLSLREPVDVEERYGAPGTRKGSGGHAALPPGVAGPSHVPSS